MDGRTVVERLAAGLGVLGLLAVLPFYISSGLAAPFWAIVVLLVFWAALVLCAVRWFRTRPWLVLVLPLVAAAVWWASMMLGEQLLGWQA
ncbi:hypothetical protein ACOCJ4_08080 [Knoellia sp. CPCC 206435]|uniref:hypothetical protein n=1 Tax=Knoellia terrae TaxID=3404797 RepID=UPI003B43A243